MSLTYVIPDIHGRSDLLGSGLADIPAHARGNSGAIVTIGEYVNKGPQSRQVIDRLLAGVAFGWKFVALKGNHDALMAQALREPSKMAAWRRWPPMAAIPQPCRKSISRGSTDCG
jgi:serine/threonine protein phosphatase 1